MNVQHYTYKVEFQERGAGHIHGTLWLNLDKLERVERPLTGQITDRKKQTEESLKITLDRPFRSISTAFKKLKNNGDLNRIELESLTNFVNEFTTVSTNKEQVGRKVAEIVLEVNKHTHTKSCRKYDTNL